MIRIYLLIGFAALSLGCQKEQTSAPSEADAPASETTQTAFNEAGAPTIQIKVPEIHCESCVKQVTEALASQAGVADVIVSLESKVATVAINEEEFKAKDAIATLVDYQFFESEVVEPGDESTDSSSEETEEPQAKEDSEADSTSE